jgi:hypothetical protein
LTAAYAAGNGANDYLQKQSASGQASVLSKAIGRSCIVKTPYFMGMGVNVPGFPKNQALWSAKCSNGATFAVRVNPDGSSLVMECSVFESLNGVHCFKKIKVK